VNYFTLHYSLVNPSYCILINFQSFAFQPRIVTKLQYLEKSCSWVIVTTLVARCMLHSK